MGIIGKLFADVLLVFDKGGYVMWPMLAISILAMAVGIERYGVFREAVSSPDYVDKLTTAIFNNDWQEALALSREAKGTVPVLVRDALGRVQDGLDFRAAFEHEQEMTSNSLKDRLHYLHTIATLAPTMALLGTVSGIIHSFGLNAAQVGTWVLWRKGSARR